MIYVLSGIYLISCIVMAREVLISLVLLAWADEEAKEGGGGNINE